ncbi:MAG: hypothetical protein E7054_07380 [Lentisphaerae bacterium]|nr:hypothetical protein [Lentisphaerota bacterium]
MMNKKEQRGVALLFALGMLTILLVTGMAFVANALTAQKVAANNGARSQGRVFAQSALSRVMASIMLYQYQVQKSLGEFPDNFDAIQSYGKVNTGAVETETSDGLTGADSLLKLPNDNSIISIGLAKQFNNALTASNDVKWVYFYDSNDATDRKIIGRAAWKVISTSPQISAPVFLSGLLPTDGTPGWYPSRHRWGREIDEVSFASGSLFHPATQVVWNNQFTMQDHEKIYSTLSLGTSDDAKKRFIDRWFMPDPDSSDFVSEPTPFVPEVYSYKENDNGKVMQAMRFNISELNIYDKDKAWNELYKVPAAADPWYARFGIDSTAVTNTCNSDDFLTKNLTADSPNAAINDKFDYELAKEDRPSLPFLRRIGNDKATFDNLTDLRKQIAANFNDYCDKDNIPTSNISAEKWMDEIVDGYTHPSYTGNEKTPYIYELGFRLGVFPEKEGVLDHSTTALPATQESTAADGSGNYTATLSPVYAAVAPIVKLANVYDFDPGTTFSNFTAGVDLGKLEIKFKPSTITLKVEYSQTTDTGAGQVETDQEPETLEKVSAADLNFSEITGIIDDNVLKTSTLTITNDLLLNTAGATPYPMMYPAISGEGENKNVKDDKNAKLNIGDGKFTFRFSNDNFKSLAPHIADPKVKKVTLVSLDAIEITSVKLNIKRATLSAAINSKNTGLDYVKTMPELVWQSDGSSITAKIPVKENTKTPGIFIGGIRNYDPRQNLNPDDWYKNLTIREADDICDPANSVQAKEVIITGAVNTANDTAAESAENNKFNPGFDSVDKDMEQTTQPGWRYTGTGDFNDQRLSTAFIRNAPMMSPWEIGLIHRGARWQTINISNACDPDDNGQNIKLTGHKPHNNSWELSGTKYGGTTGYFGDAAILDQIKMTDKCATYGKININRLRQNDELFNKEGADLNLEQYIADALFRGVRTGENITQFYKNSTREANDDFPTADNGTSTVIGALSPQALNRLTANRDAHSSRANFIGWGFGNLEEAFGAASPANTDAAREEIIGKTINLLCAETSSPSQIKVAVIAQVIKDAAGIQFRKDSSGNNVQADCEFGQFDYNSTSNIYFDEIIGEVKMLVTIERDITTGQMLIRRTDYLE